MTSSFRTCGVLAIAACLGAARPLAQTPSFRAGTDLVSVDVSVQRRGRPVTGLTAVDFELLDNGVPQRVAQLVYESLPIDLTVALDTSGSVSGAVIDQLRRSVRELASDLARSDRLLLLTFNARVDRLLDFDAPRSSTDTLFDKIQSSGGTALFDAMALALTQLATPDRRRLVVVFTDGDDRNSITTPDQLLDVVRHTTPTVGVVLPSMRLLTGVASGEASPIERVREQQLQQLAAETGGFLHKVDEGESLAPVFRHVLADFRQSYVLYFVPAGVPRSGTHALAVSVKRPDVEVHARRTYASK